MAVRLAACLAVPVVPSVEGVNLPAGLHNARDLALERERAEAQTAAAELAQKRARTAAELAAVVLAGFELRLACIFDALCCGGHIFTLSILDANSGAEAPVVPA